MERITSHSLRIFFFWKQGEKPFPLLNRPKQIQSRGVQVPQALTEGSSQQVSTECPVPGAVQGAGAGANAPHLVPCRAPEQLRRAAERGVVPPRRLDPALPESGRAWTGCSQQGRGLHRAKGCALGYRGATQKAV